MLMLLNQVTVGGSSGPRSYLPGWQPGPNPNADVLALVAAIEAAGGTFIDDSQIGQAALDYVAANTRDPGSGNNSMVLIASVIATAAGVTPVPPPSMMMAPNPEMEAPHHPQPGVVRLDPARVALVRQARAAGMSADDAAAVEAAMKANGLEQDAAMFDACWRYTAMTSGEST